MSEETEKGQEHVGQFEELIQHLHDEGALEFPERQPDERTGFAFIEPSEAAMEAARRVRKRVLSRIGLADVGSYIARERKARDLKPQEIAKSIKLSREVLAGIEAGRIQLFDLSVQKAADLVEVLNLDSSLILWLLRSLDLPPGASEQPAPLLRTDTGLPGDQRAALDRKSLESSHEDQDRQAQLGEFIEGFTNELTRRGVMK